MRSFFGMLGLIALIAAVLVGSLAAAGTFGNAPTSTRVGAPGGAQGFAVIEPTTRTIDESVTAGKLDWTVHEVRRTGELRAYTYPPTTLHGDFLVVTFSVENTSDEPITLTGDSIALANKNGRESHPSANVNSEYVDPAKAILFNERGRLDPGEKREGRVNFDLAFPFGVAPSAKLSGFRLQLGDGDPTAHEEQHLDLGF